MVTIQELVDQHFMESSGRCTVFNGGVMCGHMRHDSARRFVNFGGKPPLLVLEGTYFDGEKERVAVINKYLLVSGNR